jgi:hypothetical protein
MTRRRRLLGVYGRLGRTCWAWAPTLLVLATIVFIPLGFIDALLEGVNTSALNVTDGFRLVALIGATGAIAASSIFGEVFFSGAIAASLTHPAERERPSFLELARHISYGRLIVVDILFVGTVILGAIFFLVGAFVVAVYFYLAGVVVELEKCGVREGFARSYRLVRGHFWMVAAVVLPVEIVGDSINEALVNLAHHLLGHGLLAAWVGESVGNIVTAPVASVAIVLLALDLIEYREGTAPRLKHRPGAIPTPEAA